MKNTGIESSFREVRNINGQRVCDMSLDCKAIVIRRRDARTIIRIVDGHLEVENTEASA